MSIDSKIGASGNGIASNRYWTSSSGTSSDDEETPDDEFRRTLDSIKRSTRIQLHIGGEYSDWTPHEAFRELVQNW